MKKHSKSFFLILAVAVLLTALTLITSAAFDQTQQAGTSYAFEVSFDNGGTKAVRGYATTLAEAIENAKAGDTITLLSNASESAAITIDKSLTLDGAGYTLDFGALAGKLITLTNATLDVKDLTVKATDTSSATVIFYLGGNAALTLTNTNTNGGTNSDGKLLAGGYYTVKLENENNTLTINSGTYFAYGITVYAIGNGSITVNNGKLLHAGALDYPGSLYTNNTVALTINDGLFSYIDCDPATLSTTPTNVYGKKTGHAVRVYSTAPTVINGGTFYCGNGTGVIFPGGDQIDLTITGGRFYGFSWLRLATGLLGGTINIYGGSYYSNPGQDNCTGFLLQAPVNLNIFGGEYYLKGNSNVDNAMFMLNVENVNVRLYGGTFNDASNVADHAIFRVKKAAVSITVLPKGTTITDQNGKPATSTGVTFKKTNGGKIFRIYYSCEVVVDGAIIEHSGSGGNTFSINANTPKITVKNTKITLLDGTAALHLASGDITLTNTAFIIDGGVLPADDAKWKDCTFSLIGDVANVTLGEGDTVSFGSESEAIAEAQRIFLKQYSSNQHIKIGENLFADGIKTLTPFIIGTGATLTVTGGTYASSVPLFEVKGGALLIKGGNHAMTGNDRYVRISAGTLSVSGNTVFETTVTCTAGRGFAYASGGTLTFEGGSFTLKNGGSIVYNAASADIIVKNGSFTKKTSTSSDSYSQGSLFYFAGENSTATLTIENGTFTSHSFVRIYAECTDGTSGVRISVKGGTFIGNANSKVNVNNRYLFQVAKKGKHVIEMTGIPTVTSSDYSFIFNCNSSGAGATFLVHGGIYKGGIVWFGNNQNNVTLSIKNATFVDESGKMPGAEGAAIYTTAKTTNFSVENATLTLKTQGLSLFNISDSTDFSIKDSTVMAPSLCYDNGAKSFAITNSVIIVTSNDSIIFYPTYAVLDRVVLLSVKGNAAIYKNTLTAYSADVYYGGVAYKSWFTTPASEENAPAMSGGAELLLSDNAATSGIRFTSTVTADVMAALRAKYEGAEFRFYTLITPASYVVGARAFTKEALAARGHKVPYEAILAKNSLRYDEDGAVSFSGTLINLKSNTRAFAAVPYIEVVDGEGNVLNTIYGAYSSHDNARTAEQIADNLRFEKTLYNEMSVTERARVDAYADGVASELEGREIIVIGNSYTYYGRCVIEKTQSVRNQRARSNDQGYLYLLFEANDITVSITNWTWGGHNLHELFSGSCSADRGCDGVDHKAAIVDPCFDYVVIQEGSGSSGLFHSMIDTVVDFFEAANPNVQFVLIGHHSNHISTNANYQEVRVALKDMAARGMIIADWGKLTTDIFNGNVQVPGATQDYYKDSFVVHWPGDNYHPNMLSGYVTALWLYSVITGDKAEGQTWDFCTDETINSKFDVDAFVDKYYTEGTTNLKEIFASEADMLGIQKLIDEYIAAKHYLYYE